MRRIRDPQQIRLFDPFQGVLSAMARKRIAHGWQGLVCTVVLKSLPISTLAEHFSPDGGCPTKELYSMAGLAHFSLTGLADFFGWNALEAADAYMMRTDVQSAQRRLAARRAEERTPVFREHYSVRSGIESTNSGLKNRLGLGWLGRFLPSFRVSDTASGRRFDCSARSRDLPLKIPRHPHRSRLMFCRRRQI